MPLGTEVGLGLRNIVLDGDPAPLPSRCTAPQFSANVRFRPMSIVATVAHFSCCWALYSYAVNGHPGVSDCQSVDRQVKKAYW